MCYLMLLHNILHNIYSWVFIFIFLNITMCRHVPWRGITSRPKIMVKLESTIGSREESTICMQPGPTQSLRGSPQVKKAFIPLRGLCVPHFYGLEFLIHCSTDFMSSAVTPEECRIGAGDKTYVRWAHNEVTVHLEVYQLVYCSDSVTD